MSTSRRRRTVPVLLAVALLTRTSLIPVSIASAGASPGLVGEVRAASGTPVAGSAVGLFEQATGVLSASTKTSPSGEFRFETVRPGRYTLAVGVADWTFTSATYVATVAEAGSPDTRVDWTLYPAGVTPPTVQVAAADDSRSVVGVVSKAEPAAPLATSAFVAEVPAWVLATGAAGVAVGASLGGLCLSGTAICEEAKTTASPQE